jgi:signal transduction histidine kinase
VRLLRSRDALLVLPLLALAVWEVPTRAGEPHTNFAWLAITTFLPLLALLMSRARPLEVLVLVSVLFGAYPVPDDRSPEVLSQSLAFMLALYMAASQLPGRRAGLALMVGLVAGAVRSFGLAEYDAPAAATNSVFAVLPWLVGRAVGAKERRAVSAENVAAEAERRTREVEAEAVQAERQRIARELHDVVAHSVTVMVLQARGGRRCLPGDTAMARASLDAIEALGSEALRELRQMLALMPVEDVAPVDPLPGLANAGALVENVRRAGLNVELVLEGDGPALPSGADVSAYRVLQEALTNAVRYGAPPATARITHRADSVEIAVISRVGEEQAPELVGAGRGLVGARERVAVFGGTFSAQRRGKEFEVLAVLPRRSAS